MHHRLRALFQEALEPGILSIDTVNDSASNAIIYSDNNSYYNMRAIFEEYSEISLVNWLANMNIDSDVETDTSFPHYSVIGKVMDECLFIFHLF